MSGKRSNKNTKKKSTDSSSYVEPEDIRDSMDDIIEELNQDIQQTPTQPTKRKRSSSSFKLSDYEDLEAAESTHKKKKTDKISAPETPKPQQEPKLVAAPKVSPKAPKIWLAPEAVCMKLLQNGCAPIGKNPSGMNFLWLHFFSYFLLDSYSLSIYVLTNFSFF